MASTGVPIPIVAVTLGVSFDDYGDDDMYANITYCTCTQLCLMCETCLLLVNRLKSIMLLNLPVILSVNSLKIHLLFLKLFPHK